MFTHSQREENYASHTSFCTSSLRYDDNKRLKNSSNAEATDSASNKELLNVSLHRVIKIMRREM